MEQEYFVEKLIIKQDYVIGMSMFFIFLVLFITSIIKYKNAKLEIFQENNTWKDLMDESQYKGLQNIHNMKINVSKLEMFLYALGSIIGLSLLFYFKMK